MSSPVLKKKPWVRAIGKSGLLVKLASKFIGPWIKFVKSTSRWTFVGDDHLDALQASEQGFILAFWHSRLLMTASIRDKTDRRIYMLSSAHRDSDIIINAVRRFDIDFIRGSAANTKKRSKDKSGASALIQMIAALEDGQIVGLTPDGPRGPRQKVQPGIVRLAIMTKAPILPIAYATSNGATLNTWDRFFLAMPFSKGAFVAAKPIIPPGNADHEGVRATQLLLEDSLNAALTQAEIAVGRSPSGPKTQ